MVMQNTIRWILYSNKSAPTTDLDANTDYVKTSGEIILDKEKHFEKFQQLGLFMFIYTVVHFSR